MLSRTHLSRLADGLSEMMERVSRLFLAALLFGLSGGIGAESDEKQLPTLKPPKVIERAPIVYPHAAIRRGQEGWVELETMVDRNGRPYDMVVVDATGHPAFQRAAIRSLSETTFEPGEYQGEKVDAVHNFRVVFSLHEGSAAYFGPFKTNFVNTLRAIDTADQTDVLSRLEKLRDRIKTLYEHSMYWTAHFYYERKWGTPIQQLSSVNRALAYSEKPRNMDASLFQKLLWSKLELQIELGHYGESLRTIRLLEKLDGVEEALLSQLVQYKNSIEELRQADTAYPVQGVLNKDGKWKYVLLRDQFGVTDVKGVINEFQLYCQRELLRFKFELDFEYTLDGTNGTCSLWAIGKPDSEFTFIQL